MKLIRFVIYLIAPLMAFSCAPKQQSVCRAEKILAEINDPNSDYVIVISHRGDWRNYPENSIPAIESVIRMGVDMTYDSLMTFNLKRAHGVKTDTLKMPTLREALLVCKDRILVNVDHAYPYYNEIVELTEELGVTGQVLMKGKSGIDKVNEDMSKHEHNLLYMPIIDINKPKGQALFAEYLERGVVPMAFEVCWQKSGEEIDNCVAEIKKMGSKLWINTFWPSVCGGFGNDDDAYDAPDPFAVYKKYIDMGADMIQTDRPQLLLEYLRSIGRHD